MKKIVNSFWTSAVALATLATPAFAATETINLEEGAVGETIGTLTVASLVSGIIRVLVIAAAVIFFVWLVLGGIRWIISGGDKAKTEEARNQITAALVGLVVVFSAWAIARLVDTLFNVDIFNLQITQLGTTP